MDDLFSTSSSHNPTASIVSTAAAVAGVPLRPEHGVILNQEAGLSLVTHQSHRWQDKGKTTRLRGERDDLKKFKKMKIDKYDDFCEWVDGDQTLRYRPKDQDARKHLSGWAMRNTNNHNKKVLKKSCLGVFLCTKNCMSSQGEMVTVRPATSDRARRKQMEKTCPRPGCGGKLYHKACGGKNGYPVTHFWRVTDIVILFQSKGTHDHPRPDVVKTTSMAKIALLEYHRTHRHERPKEICRKVGVHLHKSFSRVDRVARQLREVQSAIPKDDKDAGVVYPGAQRTYTLRSHVRGLFASPQKGSEAEQYGEQAMQPYGTRHPYAGFYSHEGHMDTWSPYASADYAYAAYTPNEHFAYQAAYAGYPSGPHELTPYDQTKIESYGYGASSELAHPHLAPTHEIHEVYTHIPQQPLNVIGSRDDDMSITCQSNVMETNNTVTYSDIQNVSPTATLVNPTTSIADTIQPIDMSTTTLETPMTSSVDQKREYHLGPFSYTSAPSLKRPAPPELQPLQPVSKQQKTTEVRDKQEPSAIKLTEHTPSINIDLSNFSDIFDIGAGMSDEGLAGRPKPPVYQALSPVSNDDDQLAKNPLSNEETSSSQITTSPKPVRDGKSGTADQERFGSPQKEAERREVKHIHEISINVTSSTTNVTSSPQESPVFTQLGSSTTNTSSTSGGEADLDLLVSMYLAKDSEKSLSHLKNEFHVYTDKNNPLHSKSYAYRQDVSHYPHHEFFRSPGSSVGLEGWYEAERRTHALRSSMVNEVEGYYPSFSHASHMDAHPLNASHYHGDAVEHARLFYNHGPGLSSSRYNRHVY